MRFLDGPRFSHFDCAGRFFDATANNTTSHITRCPPPVGVIFFRANYNSWISIFTMMQTEAELTTDVNAEQSSSASLLSDFSRAPLNTPAKLAINDIVDSFKKWRVWTMLAHQDIKLRYRRSVLGPFWITLSMAITVYTMGYLYGHLFHVELQHYYPFLAAGMLSWALISTMVVEFTDGFTTSDSLLKQIKLPYTLYIHRLASRNFLIFFHNIVVIIPILLMYHEYAKVNWHTLLVIPGLVILYINAISFGLMLAIIGARYRDISQIIKSLVQVIFFVTPVMWTPEVLNEKNQFIINLNPFYAFLEMIRAPLLGKAPSLMNISVVFTMTILGMLLSFSLFSRYRARIIYWL
jgi:lipopolysaccharide transport system permease protein